MELDAETVLNAFEAELAVRQVEPLSLLERVLLRSFLEREIDRSPAPRLGNMAKSMDKDASYIRDVASKLYKKVNAVVGLRVNKQTCGKAVVEWYKQATRFDASQFFGRHQELQTLERQIIQGRRRVICIYGPPKIGKTYLVNQLCESLRNTAQFEQPIWCYATDLRNIESLYQFVSDRIGGNNASSTPAAAALRALLDSEKRVLVIEKTEVLHDPATVDGRFKQDSACYEQWLWSLLDRSRLESCVILVCRVPPRCLLRQHDILFNYPLRGLDEASAESLLKQSGLSEQSPEELRRLSKFCGYSPGVLRAAAYKITESGSSSVNEFISSPLLSSHADDHDWLEAVRELTDQEHELMGWLLLHPWERIVESRGKLTLNGRPIKPSLSFMQSLRRRGLAETIDGAYCIAMDWIRHVMTKHLLEGLVQALDNRDIHTLNHHPLIVPCAPLWQRQWHWQQLLKPLKDEWDSVWSTVDKCKVINAMLDTIRADEVLKKGFATGNLLNIAVAIEADLKSLKIAGLTIRHADFSNARFYGVDLSECSFKDTVLPFPLHGNLAAALSPDGKTIAVGDEEGHLICWRREQDAYTPYRFRAFLNSQGERLPIVKVIFGDDETIAVVAGQEVYSWWLGNDEQQARLLMSILSEATCLACCYDMDNLNYVAVGMKDGQITVWDDLKDEKISLGHHHGEVSELVPDMNPDNRQLISKGIGDRILVWDINTRRIVKEIRYDDTQIVRTAWNNDSPYLAVYRGNCVCLLADGSQKQNLRSAEGLKQIRFSRDTNYLAALKAGEVEIYARSNSAFSLFKAISAQGFNDMMLSNDGRWLLAKRYEPPQLLQIWDTKTQAVAWQVEAQLSERTLLDPVKLQKCQGLRRPERSFWESYGAVM
ncbi:hypothetical protein IQ273_14735 [Nodosilinea sp. LEGE 07298]|uniref:WD40 repeat domain-containing protein n=1 Tax=Nodosilinea sp. LEGE 07298 TaxID=2777970 RepID=UPI001880E8BE|nr:NACHT and WD repeat domain-containing protein [Nodosilinea sp. LEGE 07298]MBE9110675.1 hypothetical protein [Nodosilinea sp. LEGE 07298]